MEYWIEVDILIELLIKAAALLMALYGVYKFFIFEGVLKEKIYAALVWIIGAYVAHELAKVFVGFS